MDVLLDIILPVFGLVALGYGATFTGLFDAGAQRGLALFCFNFAIPGMLFRQLAITELPERLPYAYLLGYYGAVFIAFAIGALLAAYVYGYGRREQAVFGLGLSFSNTVLLGIPLIITTFGDIASLPVFLLIGLHMLILLPLGTLLAETDMCDASSARQGKRGLRKVIDVLGQTLWNMARNPIVLGLLAGGAFNLLGLGIPKHVDAVIARLADAALPCALFAMGASLRGYKLAGKIGEAALIAGLKTTLHPLIAYLVCAHVFGVEGIWLKVAVTMAALPGGVNVYLFATRYQTLEATAASATLLSTAFSFFTISALLLLIGPG